MKKKLRIALLFLTLISIVFFIQPPQFSNTLANDVSIEALREKHENFLKNSPFKESLKLSKKERKSKAIAPNKYFERDWELTMNPETGAPEPEKLFRIQNKLKARKLLAKVPGENANDWIERGPNNVGGRTRAIMFDPNDSSGNRVFAGGVSGGLWVNNNISNSSSSWTEVNIPNNLSISCITHDPNNPLVFYVGTGESYVQGDVQGNGVWRSTDGGLTWSRVFGGVSGETTFQTNAQITVSSPSSLAGNYMVTISDFGPGLTSLTGNLVLVNDGSASSSQGCNALINSGAISGNIAVVERGSCNFTVKVKNAQDAGAVGVIIVNNVAGPPINAQGTDLTITIPSVMISRDEGQAIINQLGTGVNVTMETIPSLVRANFITPGIQHINDIIVRDTGSTSEVYVAAGSSIYGDANPRSLFGINDFGLYKSSNTGDSWSKVNLPLTSGGLDYEPNDLEIAVDNTVWVATTTNGANQGGGTILSSFDGSSFNIRKVIPNGRRTEIAVSSTNPETLYVLAAVGSNTDPIFMSKTLDAFDNDITVNLPSDVDQDITDEDFTRGQSFYNLVIEVDPTNDAVVYAGGIDLFKSFDSGTNWGQISKWSNNNALGALSVPLVHADQHAFVFHPVNTSEAVVGNDGGVYYVSSLSSAVPSIESRERDYNTVQFYSGSIGQDLAEEKILGGSQDNGTLFVNSNSGVNGFSDINRGGDGGYIFIDRDSQFLIASFTNNQYILRNINNGGFVYDIATDANSGDFINPAGLDSEQNYLFTNGTSGNNFQINRYDLGNTSATLSVLTNPLFNGSPSAFKASTFSSNTLFVGLDTGRLFKITNSTAASPIFTQITGDDFFGSISSVELGANENEIFVTFYNYGVANVFYTSDGGTTWENKENNLPDIPVRAIMMNPLNNDEVIVGTDLGVWGTSNFNDTNPIWSQTQNGMKDVRVTSFDLRTADNTVLASTFGRGMFTGQFTGEDSTLSTSQNDLEASVKVYPTISNGNFKVSTSNEMNEGEIEVFDISGKSIYTLKTNFNQNRVQDISLNASSGLYIVKVASGSKISTHKIIIK